MGLASREAEGVGTDCVLAIGKSQPLRLADILQSKLESDSGY